MLRGILRQPVCLGAEVLGDEVEKAVRGSSCRAFEANGDLIKT